MVRGDGRDGDRCMVRDEGRDGGRRPLLKLGLRLGDRRWGARFIDFPAFECPPARPALARA